jgi:hypothetical protein
VSKFGGAPPARRFNFMRSKALETTGMRRAPLGALVWRRTAWLRLARPPANPVFKLGSGLIDQSQKMMAAAMQIAEK